MTWQRKILTTTELTRVFITGKPPNAVHVAVHGKADIFYDDSIPDDGTQWVLFWPDNGGEVQRLLESAARPNEGIVTYGEGGFRVWLPQNAAGQALNPAAIQAGVSTIPREPDGTN